MLLLIREETFEFQEITAQREMPGEVRDNNKIDVFTSQVMLRDSTKDHVLREGPTQIL